MKLDVKALAVALGVLWSGCVLLVGIGHLVWPDYGVAFLQGVSSIYPGFDVSGRFVDVLIGAVYALLDGCVGGMIVGFVYNLVRAKETAAAPRG